MSSDSPNRSPKLTSRVVVMGVSGSGKSSIGEAIGARLGIPYIDGDRYHPQANVEKMSRGEPLNDRDRAGWLDHLSNVIAERRQNDAALLIGCSALKRTYRERLRAGDPALIFLFLDGTFDVILARMEQRQHFFSPEMLETQFATLERPGPEEAIRIDIDDDFESVVAHAAAALRAYARP